MRSFDWADTRKRQFSCVTLPRGNSAGKQPAIICAFLWTWISSLDRDFLMIRLIVSGMTGQGSKTMGRASFLLCRDKTAPVFNIWENPGSLRERGGESLKLPRYGQLASKSPIQFHHAGQLLLHIIIPRLLGAQSLLRMPAEYAYAYSRYRDASQRQRSGDPYPC